MRQSMSERQLEAILSIISNRDMPQATRKAVRLRIINGYTLEQAEVVAGVTRKRIGLAIDKVETAHQVLSAAFSPSNKLPTKKVPCQNCHKSVYETDILPIAPEKGRDKECCIYCDINYQMFTD